MRTQVRQRDAHRPAAPSQPARFTVGRDHHGWWVVEDRLGRVGGIFASEDAAMHYAMEESNRDRREIRCRRGGRAIEFRIAH